MTGNLAALFFARAAEAPERPALVIPHSDGQQILRYGDLAARTRTAMAALTAGGIAPGDPLLVLEPPSADLFPTLLAMFALGATAVLPDANALAATVARACAVARPVGVIGPPKAHLWRWGHRDLRRLRGFSWSRWAPGADWLSAPSRRLSPALNLHPPGPALMTFTSGSTGAPKGVPRSHAALLAQNDALRPVLRIAPGERVLTTLPVFTLAILAAGGVAILPRARVAAPSRRQGGAVLDQLHRDGIDHLIASPPVCRALSQALSERPDRTPSRLRQVFTGGAPVPPDELATLAGRLPDRRVVAVYGASEAEPIAWLDSAEITPDDIARWHGGEGLRVGRSAPGIAVMILPDGAAAPVSARETVGEIVVSGRHVIERCAPAEAEADQKLRHAGAVWHRTGDAGAIDAHGDLILLGRAGYRMTTPGRTLYPLQIEGVCAARAPLDAVAAFPARNGRPTLVISRMGRTEASDLRARIRHLGPVDIIETGRRIPRDRRHHAKPDVPEMQAWR